MVMQMTKEQSELHQEHCGRVPKRKPGRQERCFLAEKK